VHEEPVAARIDVEVQDDIGFDGGGYEEAVDQSVAPVGTLPDVVELDSGSDSCGEQSTAHPVAEFREDFSASLASSLNSSDSDFTPGVAASWRRTRPRGETREEVLLVRFVTNLAWPS
jgi:hypothetical protein